MPRISQLLILLPCHSLEDFPIHHRGDTAANLLAHWTAIWHPALIASCGKQPEYHPADDSELSQMGGQETENSLLVVIPEVSDGLVSSQCMMNWEDQRVIVIAEVSSRAEIVAQALDSSQHARELASDVAGDLADDFFALAYAFLQTQIMTRQLRYSSNLDEGNFSEKLVAAAVAATEGRREEAESCLTACFDALLEEKNNYYPVDPELCDVVLTAPTTLGKALDRQLDECHPWNILLSGRDARTMFAEHPKTAQKLVEAVLEKRVTLIGGLEGELPFPLLSTEANLNQLKLGRATLSSQFGSAPKVYMKRMFGLTPSVPGLLDQFGFVGAILATFDDGKFPSGSGSNIRWNGDDDRAILAYGELPLSASDAGSFLGIGVRMGEAIDSAHQVCLVFVHWPGESCESYRDLIRCSKYGGLFGGFVGLNDYFEASYDPGYGETYTADDFRSPYLKQAVESNSLDPISRWTQYWRRFYRLGSLRSLLVMACGESELQATDADRIQSDINSLQSSIESAAGSQVDDGQAIDERMDQVQHEVEERLRQGAADAHSAALPELINTVSFKRIVEIQTGAGIKGTLKHQPPVVMCDRSSSGSHWIVEIPPMGSVLLDDASVESKDAFKSDPVVVEDGLLRNEYFELLLDPATGGIRAIHPYGKRGNQVGQQLAMRIPGEKTSAEGKLRRARYTHMVADEIRQVAHSRLSGSLISTGRLLDGETVVADFKQSVRVTRGKRVIEIEIEIEPHIELTHSINHYLCSRLAWKDESAIVSANVQEIKQPVMSDWFHATHFVEVKDERNRFTLLTGGLPYHRRATRRMLDSLLRVGNEREHQFRIGIVVDAPYAMAAAVDWMTPSVEICPRVASGDKRNKRDKNLSRWLFHFDSKNILATWWEPIFDGDGQWVGVQIRLRETEGRSGRLRLRCPRRIASGERTSFGGDFLLSLDVAEDDPTKLEIEFVRFEFFQVSIHWKA